MCAYIFLLVKVRGELLVYNTCALLIVNFFVPAIESQLTFVIIRAEPYYKD